MRQNTRITARLDRLEKSRPARRLDLSHLTDDQLRWMSENPEAAIAAGVLDHVDWAAV